MGTEHTVKPAKQREAAAVMLYQALEEGTPVQLVHVKLDGVRPPYLVVETSFSDVPLRYRIELVVIDAEVVQPEASSG